MPTEESIFTCKKNHKIKTCEESPGRQIVKKVNSYTQIVVYDDYYIEEALVYIMSSFLYLIHDIFSIFDQ